MSETLLRTKLYMPLPRPNLVSRPHLVRQLERGLELGHKLSLVSAPAGFGKTTLVVHWLGQQGRPVSWLSLDEADSEPLRFFAYLIAALQTVEPSLFEDLASSLRSPSPPDKQAVVPALVNGLADHRQPLILVLDDYHAIADDDIHAALALFLDNMPRGIHLVLTSREEPPLPLPRWRARGQMTDVHAAELRFTVDEAARFLNDTMGLTLAETAVADLEARTEGWVAGLQLAALSMPHGGDGERFAAEFAGSERQIADYLLQEVLFRQPPVVQQFLLQTAILDRFNARLCDDLLERSNSQDILDRLEQGNLFMIPLDNARHWYRYHHLFGELLRHRLQRDQPPEAIALLHRRAARWYAAHDLIEEAIHHALQVPDHLQVVQIIAGLPIRYIYQEGGAARILQWVKQLPEALISAYPTVAALVVAAAMFTADAGTAYRYLDLIEDEESMQAYRDLYRSILTRNEKADYERALQLAQRALSADTGEDPLFAPLALQQIAVNYQYLGQLEEADEAITTLRQAIRGDDIAALGLRLQAIDMQAQNAYAQGDLFRAERLYREGIEKASRDQSAQSPLIGLLYAGLSRILYQWNEIDQAEVYVSQALAWAERTGISDVFSYAASVRARLACLRGDAETVDAVLAELDARFNAVRLEWVRISLEQIRAWYALQLGDLDAALRWANASGLSLADEPAFHDAERHHTLAAIRLAECRQASDRSQLPDLLMLAQRLERGAATSRHVLGMINTLTLKALIMDLQGDAGAVSTIGQALSLAKPGSMMRVFLDWGEPMRSLLTKAAAVDAIYVSRLLRAFERDTAPTPSAPPAVQLTEREAEILQLIASGLSNKQIEETLYISKNTVRTHIKNLYSKLDAASRTQAIKRAHELNLLS